MKIKIHYLISLLIISFCSIISKANVITVSNNNLEVGHFSSLYDAHNAASEGDTIYLCPSLKSYTGINITKKIVVLGIGFNKINDESDVVKIDGTISFKDGSKGSTISSITGNFNIEVYAENITIQRNKLKSITVFENIKNTFILNNILRNENCDRGVIILKENSNTFIYNNIILGCQAGYWNNSSTDFAVNNICVLTSGFASVILKNNIIQGSKSVYGYEKSEIYFFNNFISCRYYGGYENVFPSIVNGIPDNKSTIFCIDERLQDHFIDVNNLNYHLKAGSNAINAGTDGKDVGIYGGEFPFIDDGAPSIPTIYYLNIPFVGTQKDGLTIEIKAKTN